jgi:hypothetical protein
MKRRALVFPALFLAACSLDVRGRGPAEEEQASPGSPGNAAIDAGASSETPDVITVEASVPATQCDRDGDKHEDPQCGGDDCCDHDARSFPGQKMFFSTADNCGSFDYDCSGKAEPETGKVDCRAGFFQCSGDGFAGDTGCGVEATFNTCSWSMFSCEKGEQKRTQRCH